MSIFNAQVYVPPPWMRSWTTWSKRDREIMSRRHEETRQRVFAMWNKQREARQ